MHTIRIIVAIFPNWFKIAEANGRKLIFFTRDITKAFLQSNPSQRLIYYRPPPEVKELYPGQEERIWREKYLFGLRKAGNYNNTTDEVGMSPFIVAHRNDT